MDIRKNLCSVIILNWNGSRMLSQYLPSVVRHTTLSGVEVVVADNGSTDDSLSVLASFPTVRVIQLERNFGFAEGYNLAISQVESEYVVLLNSDVEVAANWLEPLINYMVAHPKTGAVQPKILSWKSKEACRKAGGGEIQFEYAGAAGGFIDMLGYPFCRGRLLDIVETDRGQYDEVADIFWASGACMAIRRDVYLQVGGLDALFFAHMEEIDLCWRLNSRGYQVACVPTSVVYHLGGGSLAYFNPRKTYFNFRNNQMMLYKNMPAPTYFFVFAARLILDYMSALLFLLKRRLGDAKAVIRGRLDFWKNIGALKNKRRQNLQSNIVSKIPTMARRSVIWDYYFKHKKS